MEHEDSESTYRALIEKARQAFLHGRFTEAEEAYLAARELAESSGLPDSYLAECLNRLADFYQRLDRFAEAEPLYLRALELARTSLGPEHPFTGFMLAGLGELRHCQGRMAEAEQLLRQGLALLEKAPADYRPRLAWALLTLSSLYATERRLAESEALIRRALAVQEQAGNPGGHGELMHSFLELGRSCYLRGNHEQAEQFLQRSLEEGRKAGLADSPVMVRHYYYLADLYHAQGRKQEMATALHRALGLAERLGPQHLEIAYCLERLIGVFREEGKFRPAERFARRSLAIREAILGPCHGEVARALGDLGTVYLAWGKYRQGEKFLRRALEVAQKTYGPHDADTVTILRNLSNAAIGLGRLDEAAQWLRQALPLAEEVRGPAHPRTVKIRQALADVLRDLGREAEAAELEAQGATAEAGAAEPSPPAEAEEDPASLAQSYRELVAEARKAQGERDWARAEELFTAALQVAGRFETLDRRYGRALYELAEVCLGQQKRDEAEQYARRSLAALEEAVGPEDPDVATTLSLLAGCLARRGDFPAAEAALCRALAISEKAYGPQHEKVLRARLYLASQLRQQGRNAEAAGLARQAVAVAEALTELDDTAAQLVGALAELCERLDERAAAGLAYRRQLAALEQLRGPDHPDVMRAAFTLVKLLHRQGRYAEAEPFGRRAVEIAEKVLGQQDGEFGLYCYWLATVCEGLGRRDEAAALARRAVDSAVPPAGASSPCPDLLENMALLCQRLGEAEAAERVARLWLAEEERAGGFEHRPAVRAALLLTRLLHDQGRYAEAEPLARQLVEAGRKALPAGCWELGLRCVWLATLSEKLGRKEEAAALAREAAAIVEALPAANTPAPGLLQSLAAFCAGLGEEEAAERVYRRCLAALERDRGPCHPDLLPVLGDLGALCASLGRPVEAELLYDRRLTIAERTLPPGHPALAESLRAYAACCAGLGRLTAAQWACQRVLFSLERALPPGHPHVVAILELYAEVLRRLGDDPLADLIAGRARAGRLVQQTLACP